MYNEPQIIDGNKIFLVKRSELEGRLDAQYYNTSISIPHSIKLSSFAIVKGGKRIPKGYSYSDKKTPYYYLRVADMDSDSDINYMNLKCLDKDVYKILEKYEIRELELAISIAGTIGKVCVIHDIPLEHKVILTENCAKILIKRGSGLQIDYLKILFTMPFIQKQLEWNYIQTTIPKLGLDKIQNLRFPPVPSKEFQKQIIQIINSAYSTKKEKETEAQKLLHGVDKYLLNELGIIMPEIETGIINRLFYVQRSDLEDRLDPIFNKDYSYFKQLTSRYQWITLNDVVLNNGQYGANESAIDYTEGNVRYIRITDIDEWGNLKQEDKKSASCINSAFMLRYNDILFARSGSVGRCYIHKDLSEPSIFAGYLIRFDIDTNIIDPDYLFYYCNSKIYKFWVNTIQRPAVQANINAKEYRSLRIPLPPLSKQQEIAKQITAIRQKAKALQEEGKAILERAKKEVEQMIMGEA